MKRHELKTWPVYFQDVFDGRKKFEVRKNDRNFQVGDLLVLLEWEPESQEYTGRAVFCSVTYILDNSEFVKDGMVVMSIGPVDQSFQL